MPFLFRPSLKTPFFSLVFLRGNNNIHKPRSPHYPLLCFVIIFLLFANNPSSPKQSTKKEKKRARAPSSVSEAKRN